MLQPSTEPPNPIPDLCNISFDAVGLIGGNFKFNLKWFKGKYFFAQYDGEQKEIRSVWPELPATMTHIDAVFELFIDQVWFFIGKEIYIFDGELFKQKLSLRDIGIDDTKYSKIDSIFRWPAEDYIFILSGEDYWRLNVSWLDTKVYEGYPRKIETVWKNGQSADAVFSEQSQGLYFLKGPLFNIFTPECMLVDWDDQDRTGDNFHYCEWPGPYNFNKKPKCENADYKTASEDARLILNFFDEKRWQINSSLDTFP